MARISPTRGQKLIFVLYILLGVGILYLDITSNNFQSVKNGFKSFKISTYYFLNQITIEQIKHLSERSKSKKFLINENEMLKEALDLSYLNNYLIAKENNFYKDYEIIKYAAKSNNYQPSYKIAQLRSFDPNIFNCCDRYTFSHFSLAFFKGKLKSIELSFLLVLTLPKLSLTIFKYVYTYIYMF